ncbi:hypothetical protein BCR34DRAFT_668966 [Clohesyomyces aquaticus]|uniref:Uncharacterized protein n=1 Tax=Clohesyomyces aquaticus TaxID=1231657 RepID=A0A1Y1YHN6_9PLEO|nr:hypothetical protein BCR34DRAFT_668966 [Clohesyomyces aquaticus]
MAAVLQPPMSPMSAHSISSVHEGRSKIDMSHLSGATIAHLIMEPKIHLVTASPQSSKRSSLSKMSSNRCSVASTTKSQLRQSNHLLIEMLQNIQAELSAHRSILLDVQHRVSHLEHESVASVNSDPPPLSALHALEGRAPKRDSTLIPPEGQAWWQACQTFAKNADPPLSAREFLRTPKRFSGFDWQYGQPSGKPQTPPATPPEVEDLPPLTPTSASGEHSNLDSPRLGDGIEVDEEDFISSTPRHSQEIEDRAGIKERTVEINKKNLPAPPILLPPPEGKPVARDSEEIITAVRPIANPYRFYKGKQSLVTYRALMKNKKTEKEHFVLIHFHKAKDLKELE